MPSRCHRQISRYTCPTCNVPYCSLTCFRNEAHVQCSEPFYKRALEEGIKAQPNASTAERSKMLEMLKRFEEEQEREQELDEADEDEAETDGLAKRFADVDLDTVSHEELWSRLTPSERDAFLKAIQDPRSEGAQALLRSKELENDLTRSSILPWWEVQIEEAESESDGVMGDGSASGTRVQKVFGEAPPAMKLPMSMLREPGNGKEGPSLIYNISAVIIAYVYVTRHMAISPLSALNSSDEAEAARKLLRSLLPFLITKEARLVYAGPNEVVTNLWAKLIDTEKVSRKVFAFLLREAVFLLRPKKVTELVNNADSYLVDSADATVDILSNSNFNVLLALSDLEQLFSGHGKDSRKSETHASLKLRFYAAQVVTLGKLTGDRVFSVLANVLESKTEKLLSEDLVGNASD